MASWVDFRLPSNLQKQGREAENVRRQHRKYTDNMDASLLVLMFVLYDTFQ